MFSKRAECYLRLHKTNKTITDANRAVAMDSSSTISRWRRQEATQAVEPYFQFLDLRYGIYLHLVFLNQVCTDLWPACPWFLEITLVRTSVCVFVYVCVRPQAMKNHDDHDHSCEVKLQ